MSGLTDQSYTGNNIKTKVNPMGAINGPGILTPKMRISHGIFHLIKASQKSGKKDAVIWFTAKSVARANLQLDVALEEAGIEETGRGKYYAKPIRTDFPVYDDLPEEGAVDYTRCERYELQNDDRTAAKSHS